MIYLDYLTTHTYDELPADARSEVDRAAYDERRDMALALDDGEAAALPPALAAAFAAVTVGVPRTQGAKVVQKSRVGRPWLLSAAGWLLFAITAAVLLLRAPAERTIYEVIASDVPEPLIITKVDTLVETRTKTLTRYRTVLDTVYLEVPTVEYVSVTDTLYVPMPMTNALNTTVSGSRSLAGRKGVTRFLFATE